MASGTVPTSVLVPSLTVTGRSGGNELAFVRGMLRAGAGVGLLPAFYASTDLTQGSLVRVLPSWWTPSGSLYMVYAGARHIPRKVVAFRDFLVESFGVKVTPQRAPSA